MTMTVELGTVRPEAAPPVDTRVTCASCGKKTHLIPLRNGRQVVRAGLVGTGWRTTARGSVVEPVRTYDWCPQCWPSVLRRIAAELQGRRSAVEVVDEALAQVRTLTTDEGVLAAVEGFVVVLRERLGAAGLATGLGLGAGGGEGGG